MLRMITTALLLCATAASAGEVVIPVITGTIGDRTYRTTVDLRSGSSEECRFELRRANGSTLRSSERLDPGKPRLLDEFASEFQPLATTVRVSCTGSVDVHSRIHESNDGGTTFDEGPLYRASSSKPLVAGQTFTMPITGDFILAEVAGARARVVATLTATASDRVADRQYDIEPFAERSIGMAGVLRSLGPINAQFRVEGEGSVIILSSVVDASSANIAQRAPAAIGAQLDTQAAALAQVSATPSITEQLLISPRPHFVTQLPVSCRCATGGTTLRRERSLRQIPRATPIHRIRTSTAEAIRLTVLIRLAAPLPLAGAESSSAFARMDRATESKLPKRKPMLSWCSEFLRTMPTLDLTTKKTS